MTLEEHVMLSYRYFMIGSLCYIFSGLALKGSNHSLDEQDNPLHRVLPLTVQKVPLEQTIPLSWWAKTKSYLFSQMGRPFYPHPEWVSTEDLLKAQQLFCSFNPSLAVSEAQAHAMRDKTIPMITQYLAIDKDLDEKTEQLATCPQELVALYQSLIKAIILQFDAKTITDEEALAAARFFLHGDTDVPDWIICFQGKKLNALINAPELTAYYHHCALERQRAQAVHIFTHTLLPMLLEVEYVTLLQNRLGFNEAKALKIFFCLKHQELIDNPVPNRGCSLLFLKHDALIDLMPFISGTASISAPFRQL